MAFAGRIHSLHAGMGTVHLIEAEEGWVLVDAGSPGHAEQILEALQALGGGALRLIYITHGHFDHYGSARALQRETGAPIAIHEADEAAMAAGRTPIRSTHGYGRVARLFLPLVEWILRPQPTRANVVLADRERLDIYGLDAVVLHTPGHTPGSTSLIVGGQVAFVGDLLSTRGGLHVQDLYATDWSRLGHSLARLQAYAPERIYPGHGRRPASGAALQALTVSEE
jgi:glyoxylase-like metal-dependent hydrolase (beta-lactamase superfamily II)